MKSCLLMFLYLDIYFKNCINLIFYYISVMIFLFAYSILYISLFICIIFYLSHQLYPFLCKLLIRCNRIYIRTSESSAEHLNQIVTVELFSFINCWWSCTNNLHWFSNKSEFLQKMNRTIYHIKIYSFVYNQ